MQHRLDAELQLDAPLQADLARVGSIVVLRHEPDGTWVASTTAADGSAADLGPLPLAAAAALRGRLSPPPAVVRSVRRSVEDSTAVVGVQLRITLAAPERPPVLVQTEPPLDDSAGYTLTVAELERLAHDEGIQDTLRDRRLQDLLEKIDCAENREQALKQALVRPEFREFADRMLAVMKPAEYGGGSAAANVMTGHEL